MDAPLHDDCDDVEPIETLDDDGLGYEPLSASPATRSENSGLPSLAEVQAMTVWLRTFREIRREREGQ